MLLNLACLKPIIFTFILLILNCQLPVSQPTVQGEPVVPAPTVATPQPPIMASTAVPLPPQYLPLTQPLVAIPVLPPYSAPQLSMTVPSAIVHPGFPALPLPMSPGFGQAVPGLPPSSLVTPVLPTGQAVLVPGHVPAVTLQHLTQVTSPPVHPVPAPIGLPIASGQAGEPLLLPGDPAYQVLPPGG